MSKAGTHILRIALQGEPSVYREIEVESCKTLSDLAEVIVHALGFYPKLTGPDVTDALPKFELSADDSEETDARDVRRICLANAFPNAGHTMLLMLDYADNWRFVIEVIRRGQMTARTCYPKVLKTVGQAPEQFGS
jgi:hypothetical protein